MAGIEVFLFLLLAAAVITDLSSGRISNWIVITGSIVGIWMTDHFFVSISVSIFIILIFFPLFRIGALGAGDIKCIAMISLYLTGEELLTALFCAFLLAAVFSVCRIAACRAFLQKKNKIHLAVPIFLGVLISVGGSYL